MTRTPILLAMIIFTWLLVGLTIAAKAEYAPTYRSRPACDDCWHDGWRWRERDYRRTWRRPSHDDRCKASLAVVGDQYASESGAQGEADKAWMQTARWQHGERFMSRENAADAKYECGRSSVGSMVGQVFYRCRLSARPCHASTTNGVR